MNNCGQFKKGCTSQMKGKSWSKESREKMSLIKRGLVLSETTRRKISNALAGRKFTQEHIDKIQISRNLNREEIIKNLKEALPRGEKHHWWKGGKIVTTSGYVGLWDTNKQTYIVEHRLVMEKHLGRKLESYEVVHHKNGIRNDNRIENLELFTFPRKQPPGHQIICPDCGCNLTRKGLIL